MDPNKMTLRQRKLQTDEGIRELQGDLKFQGLGFKQLDLKNIDLCEGRLHDARTLFCDAGVLATRKSEKRIETWKRTSWYPKYDKPEARERRAALYRQHGVSLGNSEPDLRALTKLIQGSHDQLSGKKKVSEEEERQIRLAEERARMAAQLGPLGSAKQSAPAVDGDLAEGMHTLLDSSIGKQRSSSK